MDVEQAVAGAPAVRWTSRRLLPVSDERLARLVGDGHEEAFATLYERYHQRLYRYCRSMLGNDSDAQDALQSAFTGAFTALADGRRDAPVRPWLYRIAHNESISIMRRRRPEVEVAEEHIGPTASTAEVAEDRDRLALLMADLGELTERQRSALVLRELSGLSHAEVAAALGIDVSGAKQMIFEARRSLQEFAEGRAMMCDEVCRAISAGGGRTLRGRRVKAHLRDCRSCREFAEAIPARSRDLKAIAPPLAMPAVISILRRVLASSSSHPGGTAGVAVGSAGKAAGLLAAGKTLAGAAVVVTVAAGAGVVPSIGPSPGPPQADVMLLRPHVAARPQPDRSSPVARAATPTLAPGAIRSAAGAVHRYPPRDSARPPGTTTHTPGHVSPSAAGSASHAGVPAGRGRTQAPVASHSHFSSAHARAGVRPAPSRRPAFAGRPRSIPTATRLRGGQPTGSSSRLKATAGIPVPRLVPIPLNGAAGANPTTVSSRRANS